MSQKIINLIRYSWTHHFEKFATKGNEFLKELAQEIWKTENKEKAYRVLRTVLHVLRRRLNLDESFDLLHNY